MLTRIMSYGLQDPLAYPQISISFEFIKIGENMKLYMCDTSKTYIHQEDRSALF